MLTLLAGLLLHDAGAEEGQRRSKRRRMPVMAWWKSERPVYRLAQDDQLPVVTDIIEALPTPIAP